MLFVLLALLGMGSASLQCQLPSDWRSLSEGCRAELAEIIVYAKVLAVQQETYSMYNYLPWQYETPAEEGLFYSADIEMLCDQAWGSMLEVPAGSRVKLTGLGYFSCHSHTVVQGHAYYFFLRMDENYNLIPHGVNFQDAIFADTLENRRMFSSLFQFSNCSHGQNATVFSSDWEVQEDTRLLCSSVQSALFEEEDRVKELQHKVATLEDRHKQLKIRIKKLKRSLRQAKKNARHLEVTNRKLNEKLTSASKQIAHVNSFKPKHSHSTYLKV